MTPWLALLITLLSYIYFLLQLYVSNDMGVSWDGGRARVNARFYWAVPRVDADDKVIHMEVEDLSTGRWLRVVEGH